MLKVWHKDNPLTIGKFTQYLCPKHGSVHCDYGHTNKTMECYLCKSEAEK